MLIGETLRLSFAGYLLEAALPVTLGLVATWVLMLALTGGRLVNATDGALRNVTRDATPDEGIPLDRWQTIKGLTVALTIVGCFLFAPWPREVVALTGAGVLLTSRRLHSRQMLGLVDWELLVLFMGLFVVNHALQKTGLPTRLVADLTAAGVPLQHLGPLFATTFVLSNIVSNVPAVMLLLPSVTHTLAGPTLALVSTLAGNLLIVGSVANIIVVDVAARHGIAIGWREHARIGIPVTLVTLTIVAGYLALRWTAAN
jgi:Na+/H+ antiporter NhaD/arsenite permease-like protein